MPNVMLARVLIAGVSTRAMAESAAKAGYTVTSIDAFGDLDQHPGVRALSLPRDFGVPFSASAAAGESTTIECDAVAYLSPFENQPSALRRLARGRSLWGNNASVLGRVRDPGALARFAKVHSDRWLIKPRASGGGHGIRWWVPGQPVHRGWHVQRFVEGIPSSVVFVAANGNAVPFGLTRQLVGDSAFGAEGFRYCGSIMGENSPAAASANELAAVIAREFGLVGVNCIDFIDHDGVAVPIEVNPRWSASMELAERAYGVSVFGMHALACTTGALPPVAIPDAQDRYGVVGKAIVFALQDLTCGDTTPWLDDPDIRDIPHPGESIFAGRPVCTIFADGESSDACYAALVERAARIYDVLGAWSSVAV